MKEKSFTLIEVLVGIALVSIVFFGVFSAYRLSLKIVQESKNKVTAAAIANAEIEKIRNLPYSDIGVIGNYPEGELLAETTVTKSGITYNVNTRVDYVIDEEDGVGIPEDSCPNDYKRVKVEVSWEGLIGGNLAFSTDIAPPSLTEECSEDGGILGVSVFDAYGVLVPNPLIEVKDPETEEVIKSITATNGSHFFSLATSTYRVDVSKEGYSSDRSYSIFEIATPTKSNPSVLEKQLTEISFSIDSTANLSISTLSPHGGDSFSDSFTNQDNIFEINNLVLNDGLIILESSGEEYYSSGDLTSIEIIPDSLYSWNELSWNSEEPLATEIKVQLYYNSGEEWVLIPDYDLTGNGVGFDSNVDLSSLSTIAYPTLKIKGSFNTSNTSTTPELEDWEISWITDEAITIGNIDFNLKGSKLLGTDELEEPVYKFSNDYSTNSSGYLNLTDIEWDNYTLTIDSSEGLDIESINPSNPISVLPSDNKDIEIYLTSDNSLIVSIKDKDTLENIFSSEVRLYGGDYDQTNYTNQEGQTLFIPLDSGTYYLDISAPGYSPLTTSISINGDVLEGFTLQRVE